MNRLPDGAAWAVLVLSLAAAACGQAQTRKGSDPAGSSPSAPVSAGAPTAPAVLQTRSETRRFRDWSATCGNDGTCWAFGFAPDFAAGWVRVALRPGPDARPDIAFGAWPDGEAASPSRLGLEIDGRRFAAVADTDSQTPVGRITTDVAAVIDALAQGRSMRITGAANQAVSLNGAAAALLWIDEKQGRLNTTTALVRKGDRPASAVPVAPALPRVPIAPAVDQSGFADPSPALPAALRARPEVAACLQDSALPDVRDQIASARLDAGTALWAVPCGAGAYNLTQNWYLTDADGRNPRPVALAGTAGPGADPVRPDNALINGVYDPKTRTLSAFGKGRGLGDCGVLQTWAWTGERFALTRESVMGDCAGVPSELWPVTWRAR